MKKVQEQMMKLVTRCRPAIVLVASMMMIAGACSDPEADQPAEDRPPNIIYILADDLGVGDIGAYGQEKIKTPHLDALAAEGLVFDQHYSGSTVCAPSRAVLMTGQHTGHAVVRGNRGFGGFRPENERGQEPLPAGTLTIARMLQDAGYATGGFGKWGLGAVGSEGAPFRQGFDLFFGYYDQKIAHNYYPTHLWRNEERVPLKQGFIDVHPPMTEDPDAPSDYRDYLGADYAPYRIVDEAETFIRENAEQPFFVYLPVLVPHAALQISDSEIERFGYKGAFPEIPHIGDYTPHPTPRAARAAMISRMDADVGRIVALVAELGLSEDTVIMFASDNGPAAAGGSDPAFFDSAAGLRGRKRDLYEGGIRSPFIVRWPDVVPAGVRTDHVSAFWDVLATAADLAGITPPSGTDGISFAPTLTGEGAQAQHDFLYWEFFESAPAQAVRMGDWKAVRRYTGGDDDEALSPLPVELYDLAADPRETKDIADAHPDVVDRAVALMNSRTRADYPEWNFD